MAHAHRREGYAAECPPSAYEDEYAKALAEIEAQLGVAAVALADARARLLQVRIAAGKATTARRTLAE